MINAIQNTFISRLLTLISILIICYIVSAAIADIYNLKFKYVLKIVSIIITIIFVIFTIITSIIVINIYYR